MKRNLKKIYIIELIILIFIIIFKILIISKFPQYMDLSNILFFTLLCIIMSLTLGLPIDKNYKMFSSIRLIVICLFSFLILIYLLGLIMGFTKSIFNFTFWGIIKNIFPIVILLVSQEIIRFIIVKNCYHDKYPIFIIIFLFILLNIIIEINYYNFYKLEDYFCFLSVICLPIICREFLYTYISAKISLKPTILLRIAFDIYPFIFPIYPSLGNYIVSVLGISVPFVIYIILNNNIKIEKEDLSYVKKVKRKIILYPILMLLILIVCLVAGLFKYKMISIGSNSMKPTFARGDAVIYTKYSINDVNKIKVGDILVFNHNTLIITHRVKKIKIVNGKHYFVTKGDNNIKEDLFITNENKALGVINYRIKYIGYPTIWIYEALNKDSR
jgi:signal peptidase I